MLGAVELGGTWVRAAVGTAAGLGERMQVENRGPGACFAALSDFFSKWPVDRVGVASFGPVRLDQRAPDHGHLLATPKPGWGGVNVAARVQQAVGGAPVLLETDVGAALIGEHRRGSVQGIDHAAYVTVGTGVGGALLVRGRVVHGVLHPELGHLRVPRLAGDTVPGVCPFHGDCVEGLASGPALQRRFGRPGSAVPPSAPDWHPVVDALAHLVVAVAYMVAPERIVLGGGVGSADGLLPLVRTASERLDGGYRSLDWDQLLVAPALGPDAALIGGLVLAQEAD